MGNSNWELAVQNCADPERARRYAKQLFPMLRHGFEEQLAPQQAEVLAALFSGSLALTELLLVHPDWVEVVESSRLEHPRPRQGLKREVNALLEPALKAQEFSGALTKLRQFKQREMLRIAARDLARLSNASEITEEISHLADCCLHAVYQVCYQQLTLRYGVPYTREMTGVWEPSAFSILGMGKLGGQELNYSSDIDVLFVYSGEGEVLKTAPTKNFEGSGTLKNHSFYAKLSEAIIAECTRMTSDGFLFRIDLRLRPEGKTAPLARSVASYESYYAQWGQTWERMMLIKARCVGGDEGLGAEFLEMIQSFRYPRSISEQIPREVAQMKQRIENEVVRTGELERNVKLGRGGIREIEFLVQTLQVLHAGRMPFLQNHKTLPTLEKLKDYRLIEESDAAALREAYLFLRDVEHRLQMEDNRQTHTIPEDKASRLRLARLMGFKSTAQFEKKLSAHNSAVRHAYNKFISLGREQGALSLPAEVSENATAWRNVLAEHSFRDPDRCLKLVQEFVQGPGFGHVSNRTAENAVELLQKFLGLCPKRSGPNPSLELSLSDPDRVLARLDSYVASYGARSTLYDAWISNPSLFKLLLVAFDRSEYLAELAIRDPGIIDEIEQSGQLRRRKTTEQILEDLRAGRADDDQAQWLRRYYQAEQMRIGLRDILNLADAAQTQAELSALADAFLVYALEVVMRKHRLRKIPFAIFGLGKLGGRELIYASDLDILFIADEKPANLPPLQKLAVELMDLLSRRTEQGATFATDARLRPDGDKGLLVNNLEGYRDYYQKRAMLWEIQSLSRFRFVAGHPKTAETFSALARKCTDFSRAIRNPSNPSVAARFPDWKQEIFRMRMRIEKERTPAGKDPLAIKTGMGGLMDVEFIAQAICLENGWHEPNTLAALEKAGVEGVLPSKSIESLTGNYRRLIRVERILRRWSFEAESLLPADPQPFYRVSVRCGFADPAEFQEDISRIRREIRREFNAFFSS